MTEWDEYKNLDWKKLQYKMSKPVGYLIQDQ